METHAICERGVDDTDEPPAKRIRLDNFVPLQQDARLELLPSELLLMILDSSLEPSLIHVNRRLWFVLPSYRSYTQHLALRALMPAHVSPNPRIRQTDPRLDPELAKLDATTDKVPHHRLRKAVFSSSWFGERHLRHVHKRLFQNAVLRACVWHSPNGPSRGQMRRIKAFTERIGEVIPIEQLSLRLRDENGRPLNLLSSPLTLALSAQHTTSIFTPVTFAVIEFGGIVPDDFLRQPLTTRNIRLIQHISDTVARGQTKASHVSCNRQLLRKAFISSICEDYSLLFFTLFTLEALLDPSDGIVVDFEHLEWAVKKGRSRFLIAIIKRLWGYPRRLRPSDGDLIDLTNRAKACNYTDWPKTTRVLSMEVASMWKAAEVEDAGGQVNHVAHRWPPELKIAMPGHRSCQSWFIPKDFRHETVRRPFWLPHDTLLTSPRTGRTV